MISAWRRLFAGIAFCAVLLMPVRAVADEVLVFAAASLKTALDEISRTYTQETGQEIVVSYAASSVLARQIQLGAPADLFISANVAWMDVLEQGGQIDTASRLDLLGNELVLIGAPNAAPLELTEAVDLRVVLDGGHLAMALVDAVPAGIYGKAALQELGAWKDIQDRIAQADNVRAALALVAAGATPLGIVYQSDAIAEDKVSVVADIPTSLHPPIVYPAALMTEPAKGAGAFLTYLQSDPARAVFLRQGFSLPEG